MEAISRPKKSDKTSKPYLLVYIVEVLFLVATAFFEEGVAFFDPIYTTVMSDCEFCLSFFIVCILFFIFVVLARRDFSIKVNWPFFVLFAVLFVSDVVAIYCFPEFFVDKELYRLSPNLRLRFSFSWLAACFALYSIFCIIPKTVKSKRQWAFYFWGGIIVSFCAIFYSYIVESQSYYTIFHHASDARDFPNIVSFTNNKNTYGILLFIGTCSAIYLSAFCKRWFYVLFAWFFFLNQVVCGSKTSLVCSAILIVAFFIWRFVTQVKYHPFIEILLCSLAIAFVAFVFIAYFLRIGAGVSIIAAFYSYMDEIITPPFGTRFGTFNDRVGVWQIAFSVLSSSPLFLVFGMGSINSGYVLGACLPESDFSIGSAHSGFVDVICRFGIIGLLCYVFILVYFIVLVVKNLKAKHKETVISLFIFIAVLLHGILEDTNFLSAQTKNIMLLFITFVPVLTDHYLDKNLTAGANEERYAESQNRKRKKLDFVSKIKFVGFLLIPVVSVVCGLADYFSMWRSFSFFSNQIFVLQLLVCFMFSGLLIFNVAQFKSTHKETLLSVALVILFAFEALSLFGCLFFRSVGVLVFQFLLGVAGFLVGLFSIGWKSYKNMFLSSFISLLVVLLEIAFNTIVVRFYLIPYLDLQTYAAICLVFADILMPLALICLRPVSVVLIGSSGTVWGLVEDKFSAFEEMADVKRNNRFVKFRGKKGLLNS